MGEMRSDSDDDELLSAYVDGVGELTPAERERVRASADPAAIADTRALLGKLRAMPADGGEPDWAAMERAIGAAVGERAPRAWWRPSWLVPAVACAAVLASAIVVMVRDDSTSQVAIVTPPPPAPAQVQRAPAPPTEVAPDPHAGHTYVYVNGQAIDVDDVPEQQILDGLGTPDDGEDAATDDNLLGAPDLAWVDHLDTAKLDKLEHLLDKKKGT